MLKMVGPVLNLEMMLGSRRGRQYIFRWIYAAWLLLEVSVACLVYWVGSGHAFPSWFLGLFLRQHFILLVLATPVFTAGSITDEKWRGSLQYLLTADLTSWEIVAGKLLGRLAQVAVLFLTGLPVLCFFGVFGSLGPDLLLALLLVSGLLIVGVGSATMLASIWSVKTVNAVLSLYLFGVLGAILVEVLGGPLAYFSPMYVLAPAWESADADELRQRLLGAALAWGSLSGVCLALSVWRLRAAYIRQLEGEGKKRKERWWRARRAVVGAEPIRWKERHVEGLAPMDTLRQIPRWIGIVTIASLTVLIDLGILWSNVPPEISLTRLSRAVAHVDVETLQSVVQALWTSPSTSDAFLLQGLAVMFLASFVVGIRCSGAVSGERERQTWEALLLTPLETRQLIRAKLWGIIGASYPYLLAYAAAALLLSLLGGPKALFWTSLWLAVTWLAMFYIGAAGLWCSVRSKSSWRSLLGTLGFGYLGAFLLWVVASPATLILAFFIVVFLMLIDNLLGTNITRGLGPCSKVFWEAVLPASCLVLAGVFFGLAWYFIKDAEKRVADRERTRHWKYEPEYRRPRARRVARPRYYR
jgi:ABC-type transport system involved in multi-copper enzyme maturation permease subunit